jgi:hypothetical protein
MRHHLILLALLSTAMVSIDHAMVNPTDETQEYVVITGTTNLTDYTIGDTVENDTLTLIAHSDGNTSIITTDAYPHNTTHAHYTAGQKIGNGLANSGDTIYLYQNHTVIDNVTYTDSNDGTPVVFTTNPQAQTAPNTTTLSPTCTARATIELDTAVITEGNTVRFSNTAHAPANITYWVEDQHGDVVKDPVTTSNTDTKQYTPTAAGGYIIRNEIATTPCTIEQRNTATAFVVQGPRPAPTTCPVDEDDYEELSEQYLLAREQLQQRPDVIYQCEPPASIASFYTLKETYETTIKLFARVEGTGYYTARLHDTSGAYNQTVIVQDSEKLTLIVNASRGGNLYVLELTNETAVLDTALLHVTFPHDTTPRNETTENTTAVAPPMVRGSTSPNQATGAVVYDESSYAPFALSGFITVGVILASIGGWRVWREQLL